MLRAGQLADRQGPLPAELTAQDVNCAVKGMMARARTDFKPPCKDGSHLHESRLQDQCQDQEKSKTHVDQGKTIMHTN